RLPVQQPVNAATNLVLAMLLGWLCVGLTGRLLTGMGWAALPMMVIGIADRLKKNYLFDPIFPDDLGMWRDFLAVGVNFIKLGYLLLAASALALPLIGWGIDRRIKTPRLSAARRVGICLACGLALAAVIAAPGTSIAGAMSTWKIPSHVARSRAGYQQGGLLLSFTLNIKSDESEIVLPAPYTAPSVRQISRELLHDATPPPVPSAAMMRGISQTLLSAGTRPTTGAQLPHVVLVRAESLFPV